jgi:prepilin-type N-terminal cleavage/methylation domain-containing protein/prepilin-type processing-associated H-X9-DG protein
MQYKPHAKVAKAAKKRTGRCRRLKEFLHHLVREIYCSRFQSPLRPRRPLREAYVSWDCVVAPEGRAPIVAAFTLLELLVVIALIAALAALLFPLFGRAKESGRATVCLSNLHQMGIALQLYVQDNGNRLPYLRDKSLTATNSLPGPDLVLSNYLGNIHVLQCPSDRQNLFQTTGSSYSWNSLLNGEDADHLTALGLQFVPHQIPLMFDKDRFHKARGPKKEVNYLYADGHIKNLLAIEGTIQPTQPTQ